MCHCTCDVCGSHLLFVWGQLWRQLVPRVPSVLHLHLVLLKQAHAQWRHASRPVHKKHQVCIDSSVRISQRLMSKQNKTSSSWWQGGVDSSWGEKHSDASAVWRSIPRLVLISQHHFQEQTTSSNSWLFTCQTGWISWHAQRLAVKTMSGSQNQTIGDKHYRQPCVESPPLRPYRDNMGASDFSQKKLGR